MTNAKLIFICCLLICLAACSNNLLNITKESSEQKSQKFIIPQNYVGWVRVSYEVPNAPPLPIEDGNSIYRIPDSGFLETSSKKSEDVMDPVKYFYSINNSLTEIKITSWGKGGMVWGGYTEIGIEPNAGKKDGSYLGFFVGTEQEFKEYGLKMEEKVGRIAIKP